MLTQNNTTRRFSFTRFLALSLGLSVAGVASRAQAQRTWDGDASQDWNNGLNWSGDTLPAGVNAIINTATGNYPIIGLGGSSSAFTPVDVFVGRGAGNTGRLDHTAGT